MPELQAQPPPRTLRALRSRTLPAQPHRKRVGMPNVLRPSCSAATRLRPVRARPRHQDRRDRQKSRSMRQLLPGTGDNVLCLRAAAAMPRRQERKTDMQFLSAAVQAIMRCLRAGQAGSHELADGTHLRRMLQEDPRNARDLPPMRTDSATGRKHPRRGQNLRSLWRLRTQVGLPGMRDNG